MRIFRGITDSTINSPTVLTFGVFDGLHLAHQKIMRRVVERAKILEVPATVVTFDPHPRAVLHPETAPPLLQTFEQKMDGMERLGMTAEFWLAMIENFDRRFHTAAGSSQEMANEAARRGRRWQGVGPMRGAVG